MSIQLIVGPMFSGKTTELMRRVKRHEAAQRRCVIIKHCADTRYSKNCVATHDRQTLAAWSCAKLNDVAHEVLRYDVVGVDEGQFFPDLISFCEFLANQNKIVIVAALDGTFQRKPFGQVLELIPMAEKVEKLNSICMHCCADAAFTKRITSDTPTVEIDIGGADKYAAVCRKCFFLAPVS